MAFWLLFVFVSLGLGGGVVLACGDFFVFVVFFFYLWFFVGCVFLVSGLFGHIFGYAFSLGVVLLIFFFLFGVFWSALVG